MSPNAKKMTGIIKAAQHYLSLDDETYRAILERLTGKRSATQLTLKELETVREYFHEQGYPRKTARKIGRKPNVPASRSTILSKIEALLAAAERPWAYAESMAQHMFKRQAIEWLDTKQLTKLMQALVIDAKRRQKQGGE